MSLIRKLAVKAGWLEHRREGRLPAAELNASYRAGSKTTQVALKDISSSGLYLFTADRWMPGTKIDLTVRKRSIFEMQPAESVRLRARSVRLGADGVGLTFESDHVATDTWMSLFVKATGALRQKDPVRALRIARALAFLRRISPDSESAVMEHIVGESLFESGERAVETILNAEEIVESWNFAIRTGVDPSLIVSILENASKTNSGLIRHRWAGLLASSVQYWAKDCESAQFADVLSSLDPVRVRLLEAACSRALRAGRDGGDSYARNLSYSRQAMRNLAGMSDLWAIEQHLDCLAFFKLLEAPVKHPWFEEFKEIELIPTQLGLKFYARCRGLLSPPDVSPGASEEPVIEFQAMRDEPEPAHEDFLSVYAPAS